MAFRDPCATLKSSRPSGACVKITAVRAREVLDSRGNPTVEVELSSGKLTARALVPSGVSTGKNEALELRDGDARFHGKGVRKACANVMAMEKQLSSAELADQQQLDELLLRLDGTADKSKLGANALLGVSLAAARLFALEAGKELHEHLARLCAPKEKNLLPIPFCLVLEGGKHAGNELAVQEFMVAPVKAKSFSEGIRMVSEVYHELRGLLLTSHGKSAVNVGDEGGFAPQLATTEEALVLITDAIDKAGHGKVMRVAIDAAASEFFHGTYRIDGKELTAADLLVHYEDILDDYPMVSVEDPFEQDAFEDFAKMTSAFGCTQIVGDDLLCTNPARIRIAAEKKSCNALLLKVNQIGTLSEAIASAKLAEGHGWKVMVSHRSGETEDTFIADLAVALGCGQLKSGAPCRGERTAKFNQLLRIEESRKARYPTSLFS